MTEQSLFGAPVPTQRTLGLDGSGEIARAAAAIVGHADAIARVLADARDELARLRTLTRGSPDEARVVQACTMLEAAACGVANARASVRDLSHGSPD